MPYSFDYAPGHITAQFSHSDFDSIDLDLRLGGEVTEITECDEEGEALSTRTVQTSSVECNMFVSSVWCPFGDFVRFLEAIVVGVQECAFSWDAEGPCGEMRWYDSGDRGMLKVVWRSRGNSFNYQCSLAKRQVLEALYSGFRTFVDSPAYQPLRYESLTVGEGFDLVLEDASARDLAAALVPLDAERAMGVLEKVEHAIHVADAAAVRMRFPLAEFLAGEDVAPCDENHPAFAGWEACDPSQRLALLHEFFGHDRSGWFGANLRKLRSRIVEEWLAAAR
jgi:hypothetical protein